MSGDGIFHIDASGELVSMVVTPYDAEDVLQELLEKHPDLLAGGQMTPHEPRRWALVKREQGVPDRESSSTRWSIDHLFVDQDAVPTLVEVKRSSDTRIRREVVGQMLDYAANGVRYWPPAVLQVAFETTQRDLNRDPSEVIGELSDDQLEDIDAFFVRVADNLRAGRIRMVFVADVIPDELMRITEFLNEQMSPADVFAVEVKQYRAPGHDSIVIVPAVYGRTATASVKSSQRGAPDRASLLAKATSETHEVIDRLSTWAVCAGKVGTESPGGFIVRNADSRGIANVYLSYNALDIPIQPLRERGFVAEAEEVFARVQALTDKRLTNRVPSVPTADALARWSDVVEILDDLSEMYGSSDATK